MPKSEKLTRVNKVKCTIWLVPELKDYLDEQSIAFGMSQSAYLTMLIQNYRQQASVINNIPGMIEQMKKQEMQEQLKMQNITAPQGGGDRQKELEK